MRKILFIFLSILALFTFADEKTIILEEIPDLTGRNFEVSKDGKFLYFGAGENAYTIVNWEGKICGKIGCPSAPKEIIPLPDGWFIADISHANGHIAMYRPDGTYYKMIVGRGGDEKHLRADMTGWTSPTGIAVDYERKLIFALDTTLAPPNFPDPDWSRIVVFDFNGNYIRDINRYDCRKPDADDNKRTWYEDIEVDPKLQIIYVSARRFNEIWAFDYNGEFLGKTKGYGKIGVFEDSRVAFSPDGKGIGIFRIKREDKNIIFEQINYINLPQGLSLYHPWGMYVDIETDENGCLYISTPDKTVTFVKWKPDFKEYETFGPEFIKVKVEFPDSIFVSGSEIDLKVNVSGRPEVAEKNKWKVKIRKSDGSDLKWSEIKSEYKDNFLKIKIPENIDGIHEICVRYGEGWIDWMNREKDPYIQKTIMLIPQNVEKSVTIISQTCRTNFIQGEKIDFAIIKKEKNPEQKSLKISLKHENEIIFEKNIEVLNSFYGFIPSEITGNLLPGEYELTSFIENYKIYPFKFNIVSNLPESEMQRILYHEFPNEPITLSQKVADYPESISYINDYLEQLNYMNFNRETVRDASYGGWRKDYCPFDVSHPALSIPEFYKFPGYQKWQQELYLDKAVKYKTYLDLQILYHCAHAVYIPEHIQKYIPTLQIITQWLMKFPSFYGFNYNDEMFFGSWGWTADMQQYGDKPQKWLKEKYEEKFKNRPWTDVLLYALDVMYSNFNNAVREINKNIKITTTPMWQYPAVEGSYAPVIYKDMDESYSHFLSEGYHIPWYAPHSVDFLKRPELPIMGVFDNNYSAGEGDIYVKNSNLVLGRGVQGIGTQHTRPFNDWNASYKIKVVNEIAKEFGGIYSKSTPSNEGAILYSYTQDVKEGRNCMGTPHWEKVWAVYGAGLMAGIPMSIIYEEDIINGYLFDEEKNKKFGMLFIIGIKELPENVKKQIEIFISKGGNVFYDEESLKFEKGIPINLENFYSELKTAMWQGYAADSWFPLLQPILEKITLKLKYYCDKYKNFPVDTDDLWVSKNIFDGGEVKYIHLASEMSPFPWKPEDAWFLGTFFRKGYLPKTINLSFPYIKNSEVYDVYNHTLLKPEIQGNLYRLKLNLLNYSGKLLSIVPEGIGSIYISSSERKDSINISIGVKNKKGNLIKGIIPLKIEIYDGKENLVERIYRTTEKNGVFTLKYQLPLNETNLKLKITELITGKTKNIEFNFTSTLSGDWIYQDSNIKVFREENIKNILKEMAKNKKVIIITPPASKEYLEKMQEIKEILNEEGIDVIFDTKLSSEVKIFITSGWIEKRETEGEIIEKCKNLGILDLPVTKNIIGNERCLITAIYSIPDSDKKGIIILGGDEKGLINGIKSFEEFLLSGKFSLQSYKLKINSTIRNVKYGKDENSELETLEEKTGVSLKDIKISENGKYILIGAETYMKNIALIEDNGNNGEVIKVERIGQSEKIYNLYLNEKNKKFGAATRTINNGDVFYLYDFEKGLLNIFPSFGDSFGSSFGISDDGNIVIIGGKYGVICYKFENNKWVKKWSIDYWKEFDKLEWPVSDKDERCPQFNVSIPEGKDYAIILFSETTNNGWITPDHFYNAEIFGVKIETGEILWKYKWDEKELYFPSQIILSKNGEIILLNLQIGSWGREKRKILLFNNKGENLCNWTIQQGFTPIDIKINEKEKLIGIIYSPRRLIEIRDFKGKVILSLLWKNQPISLDFIEKSIIINDEGGKISKIDYEGNLIEKRDLNFNIKKLCVLNEKIYTISYNGFLIVFDKNLKELWKIDMDKFLNIENPMEMMKNFKIDKNLIITTPEYNSTTKNFIPSGEDKIKKGLANIKIGGTGGWMSEGKVEIKEDDLKNGKYDDVKHPLLNLDELFWDATAGRQIWIEIEFKKEEDVQYLTIYENPEFPESFIKEAVVQKWDEDEKKWKTVKFGIFMNSSVNTFELNLKNVKKLRFVPISNYYKNFYITEIEAR